MNQEVQILLVEDNPADTRLTIEAFKELSTPLHMSVVSDGTEAIAFLRKLGRFADVPTINIVLLDLNLPGKTGREVLTEIKNDPLLASIPVLILTTSQSSADIEQAYALGANSYMVKSSDIDHFFRLIQHLDDFWLRRVSLPLSASGYGDGPVQGKTVMVVDNSPEVVTAVRPILEEAGMTVLEAQGAEAIGLARTCKPDVILLDMNLPILDGARMIRMLQDDPATNAIPVVGMSTQSHASLSATIPKSEAWLVKPLTKEALLRVMAPWLSSQESTNDQQRGSSHVGY